MAETILQEALQWVLATNDYQNQQCLCWFGSLSDFAAEVLLACEKAVATAHPRAVARYPRHSEGLARALTGDFAGAVETLKPS